MKKQTYIIDEERKGRRLMQTNLALQAVRKVCEELKGDYKITIEKINEAHN